MISFIGTAQKAHESFLFFSRTKETLHFLNYIKSLDGFSFSEQKKYVIITDDKNREEKNYQFSNFHITKHQDQFMLFYQTKKSAQFTSATSTDLIRWKKTGKLSPNIKETAAILSDYKHNNQYVMYLGEKEIKIAYSQDLLNWDLGQSILTPRKDSFDDTILEVGNAFVRENALLVTYYVKKEEAGELRYLVGAALFDKLQPEKLLWRPEQPLWNPPRELAHENIKPLGAVILDDQLIFYWTVSNRDVFAVTCPIPQTPTGITYKTFSTLFKKTEKNPIIAPRPKVPWESRATFNSAAVYEDGKVHFVYRALGDKDLSVLGYATSADGIHIDERSDEPIYIPREPFETPGGNAFQTFADHFASGGGYGGVEDPRITKVDNKFYMTYVAFDGATPPRVALTSITIDDFLNKRWAKWEKPKLISAPGMVNKNAVIFPEKINGKYVVYHRIYPNVLVDYVDDLNFEDSYLQGHHFIPPRKTHWDSKKIGAGAPPIKTQDGWLFVYQSVGYQDPGKYKIGAMLLDLDNPSKVIARANAPIVEPIEPYENDGFKAGVVYPCGAVVVNNQLHVYYGGADTVVCAASADLNTFLKELKQHKEPKLRQVKTAFLN